MLKAPDKAPLAFLGCAGLAWPAGPSATRLGPPVRSAPSSARRRRSLRRSAPPSATRLGPPVRSAPSSARRRRSLRRSAPPSATRLAPVRSLPSAAIVLRAWVSYCKGCATVCGRAKALADKLARIRLVSICFFILRLLVRAVSEYGGHITQDNLMKKSGGGMVIIDAIDIGFYSLIIKCLIDL